MARVTLTARGAIVTVFAASLVGNMMAGLTGVSQIAGVAFLAGCLTAVSLINRRDLLSLVVSPPLTFFAATLISEVIATLGAASMLQALAFGLFRALSAGAPWLFIGSALVLVVAWRRGLVANVRALRRDLRAARAGTEVPRPRVGEDGFAPEPEGYFEPRVYGRQRGKTP